MFSIRLLSLVIALSAARTALATETWEAASSRLQAHVDARQGQGAIVQLERVDAGTVRVSLKALWPRFLRASFQGGGESRLRHRLCQMEARGAETLIGTTRIEPGTTHLDVRLHGSDFNPKIRLRVPAPGQTEVDTVLMSGSPDA
ncbi:hypothetical protein [Geothrix campi]|jgi:hypothetical protein|uniref:hypothetical protein n=1 Tax=Geothrix campi TaxID=2966450 RepID=UPI0021475FC0|nr:hypothetical protein [Geothrix sp. SG10]